MLYKIMFDMVISYPGYESWALFTNIQTFLIDPS